MITKIGRPKDRIRHFAYSDAVLHNATGGVILNDRFMPPARGPSFNLSKLEIQAIVANATQADTGAHDVTIGYRAGWRNYYHWTTQCLLNNYCLYREDLLEDCILAMPELGGIQMRGLQLLGIDPRKLHTVADTGSLRAKTFRVTNILFSFAAERFPSELRSMAAALKSDAHMGNGTNHHAIYVARLDSRKRKMSNEEQLIRALEKLGVAQVSMTGKTLDEQISLFAGAKLIVAPHGAALTNILYAEPHTRLYELLPSTYVVRCYQALARAVGVTYSDSISRSSTGVRHRTVWSADVDEVCRNTELLLADVSANCTKEVPLAEVEFGL